MLMIQKPLQAPLLCKMTSTKHQEDFNVEAET